MSCKATSLQVPVMWLHAVQVAIMPCKAMSDTLDIPYSGAVACIEWCKTNFENIASMGGRQKTGIYTAAWGSDNAYDSGTLKAAIQRVGVCTESCGPLSHKALVPRAAMADATASQTQCMQRKGSMLQHAIDRPGTGTMSYSDLTIAAGRASYIGCPIACQGVPWS